LHLHFGVGIFSFPLFTDNIFPSAWVIFAPPIFLTGFRSIKCIQNKVRHKLNKYWPTRKAKANKQGFCSFFLACLASKIILKGKNGRTKEIVQKQSRRKIPRGKISCRRPTYTAQTARCQINAKSEMVMNRIVKDSNKEGNYFW